MRVGCSICGELFISSCDIAVIPCGHAFHSHCIIQWLERSKSCPQCRQKCNEKKLIKLYFDSGIAANSSEEIDPDFLLSQLENSKFQITLKNQEISKLKEQSSELKDNIQALRTDYVTIEKQLHTKDTTILALKTQLKYMDQITKDAKKCKDDAKLLKDKLKLLESVQIVVSGTSEDVDQILESYHDGSESIRNLATYISLLKKDLQKQNDHKRKWRDEASQYKAKVEGLKKNLNAALENKNMSENTIRNLENDVTHLENENASLKKKVNVLQQSIISPSGNVKNSAIHRLINESPAPTWLKRPASHTDDALVTPEVIRKLSRKESTKEESEGDGTNDDADDDVLLCSASDEDSIIIESPPKAKKMSDRRPLKNTINVRSSNIKPNNLPHHHDIFAKNKRERNAGVKSVGRSGATPFTEVGYDGLGGHHKVDLYPKPIPLYCRKKKPAAKVKVKMVGKKQQTSKVPDITNFFNTNFDE